MGNQIYMAGGGDVFPTTPSVGDRKPNPIQPTAHLG